MTLIVSTAVAGNTKAFKVTVANSGTNYGYSSAGGYGNITPGSYGNSGGAIPIFGTRSNNGFDFGIEMTTSMPQNWFERLVVQDTGGTWRNYRSADAVYASGLWTWGTGSDRVWSAVNATGRGLLIYPFKS